MRQDLLDSQRRLHDSLFELYMQGGCELMTLGTLGLQRPLTRLAWIAWKH